MPVRFECPTCKTAYDVDDELAGKSIMCRGCQKRGQVRAGGAPRTATTTATSTATATATTTAPSLAKPSLIPSAPSRREAMSLWIYGILAVGSITTGAILARTKVLRNLSIFSKEEPEDQRRRGPRKGEGPPPGTPKGP
jgi:hypothetical protein